MGYGILSALRGNLFGCGNIPEEDEYSEEYSCGSEELDVSLYVFVSVVGVVMLVIFLLRVVMARGYWVDIGKGSDCGSEVVGEVAESYAYGRGENSFLEILSKRGMYVSYLTVFRGCTLGVEARAPAGKNSKDVESSVSAAGFGGGAAILAKIRAFSQELGEVTKLFLTLVCVYLVSCVPLYGLKISEYGWEHSSSHTTHSYQYRWVLTSAFLHGEASLWLLVLVWINVLSVLSLLTVRGGVLRRWLSGGGSVSSLNPCGPTSERIATTLTTPAIVMHAQMNVGQGEGMLRGSESDNMGSHHSVKSLLRVLMIFLVNTCVVGSVCGGFIYFTSQSLPPSKVVGLQIGMALFNLAWNMAAVPVLSRPMGAADSVVLTELGLLILNNIVLPCIVTALTSPECFQVFVDVVFDDGYFV
jgi:hypothetical protein